MNCVSRSFGCVLLVVFSMVLHPSATRAGQITLADFSPAAQIQDYQILGVNSNEYATPIVVGSDTYRADDGILVSSSKLGPTIGRSGVAVGNQPEKSRALVGFIEIELGQPVLRAGVFVGFQFPWASDVQFYDAGNNFLGAASFVGSGGEARFAAWQADIGTVSRIRVVNSANPEYRIIIDDLITEVPEPAHLQLFMISAVSIASTRCRRPRMGTRYFLPVFGRIKIHDTIQHSGYQDECIGTVRQQPSASSA